jgi:hypothetical protein
MTTRRELEALPAEELADRALALARHRLDVGFFWELVRTVPEAEAAIGDVDHGKADVMWFSALLNDLGKADEGRLAEALRPLYLDYLERHEKGGSGGAGPAEGAPPDATTR